MQVIALHREHPDWDSNAIASALGCAAGYVRATAQRRGLAIKPKPRLTKKVDPKTGTRRAYRSAHGGDAATVVEPLSAKECLAEIFYEVFDNCFEQRAVFEQQPKIADEFKAARRRGQSVTGFLLGDPLPARSALAKKKAVK